MSIGWWSPSILADKICERQTIFDRFVRQILANAAADLHDDMGCKNEYTDFLISLLTCQDTKVIRLAHQANLFPYIQILAQTVHLSQTWRTLTSRQIDSVPIVFLIDYDVASSKWMNNAHIYDPFVKGHVRSFKTDLASQHLKMPAFMCPSPSSLFEEKTAKSLETFCEGQDVKVDYLLQISGLFRGHSTLSDFNTQSWMNAAISAWNLPILFLRLSDVARHFDEDRRNLAKTLSKTTNQPIEELYWGVCSKCRNRKETANKCCDGKNIDNLEIPKVTLDSLSDYELYKIDGGTAYFSGRKHLVNSHQLAVRANISVAPEASWCLNSGGWVEGSVSFAPGMSSRALRLVLEGRVSMIQYFTTLEKGLGLLEMLKAEIESTEQFPQDI